ncbi:MAG: hypothetical protein PF517_05275 [Salinivirgaceae bacterium]|jgi:hypothetical protein|nr:hypothetical protein [Salinivirgaceae bacterium]
MRFKVLIVGSIISAFVLIGAKVYADNADVKADMKKLVNYKRMVGKHYPIYIKQRNAQYKSWAKHNIPENFRIPIELQSYRDSRSVRYYGLYNAAYNTGVGYIPSNLVRYYEEEAWFAFQKYGHDAPSLSIVLAQQFTESQFNPWAIGDNNMSFGLPQLYRKTAQYLYKNDKKTWKDIFYFDKKGKHHFTSIRAMVQFPFLFLTKVKKYDFEHKFEGIRRYNGSGENAIKYAEKVMTRSLFYEELFAEYNSIPLDTTGFKKNLFDIINFTLIASGEEPIDNFLIEKLFANALAQFYSGYVRETYLQYYAVPVSENQQLLVASKTEHRIPVDGKDYYIIVEEGRVIYQYFKDSQMLLDVLNHSKNKDFYLYYIENKKRVKVVSLKKVGKKQVFSNVKPGDKVFIPPGTVLLSPETNLAVRIN